MTAQSDTTNGVMAVRIPQNAIAHYKERAERNLRTLSAEVYLVLRRDMEREAAEQTEKAT
jgi:hypothetical protein